MLKTLEIGNAEIYDDSSWYNREQRVLPSLVNLYHGNALALSPLVKITVVLSRLHFSARLHTCIWAALVRDG
jgi:hypothetical protein